MARDRRNLVPGIHQVVARGVDRQVIYQHDEDRDQFVRWLRCAVVRFAWKCLNYCLMTNHFHLLIETDEPNLDLGMKLIGGAYAQGYNRRQGRKGHLFESRYYSAPIESDAHLLAALRYDALNPVRAGICPVPQDWPWSGYAALAGYAEVPSFLAADRVLEIFGGDRSAAIERLREFVEYEWRYAADRAAGAGV